MSTPHNNAGREQIAGTVIMPGDPLRAKFIAETYLACPVLFNDVRGMYGYTGEYRGKRISVMGSGMGMPSMGIYSYELFHFYNVENIIRIGSAGSYCKELNLLDLLLVTKSYSESTYALVQSGYNKDVAFPSEILNHKLRKASEALGKRLMEGMVHSTDVFYREDSADYYKKLYGQGWKWRALHCFTMPRPVKNRRPVCLPFQIPLFQAKTQRQNRDKIPLRI